VSKLKDVIQWQTVSGEAVKVGDVALTPQSHALTVRWPNGGFVWNRPVAVLVERGGQTERIPVVDVTRIAQLTLLGLGFVFTIVTLMLSIRKRRDKNE
jgi:hypothetical protein